MVLRQLLWLSLLWLAGCATQSTVQDVRADLTFKELDIGRGRSVFLEVVDNVDASLSERGLVDERFVLALELKRDVRAALYNFGFATAYSAEEADLQLTVNADELLFVVGDDPVLTPLLLRNTVRFVLQKNLVLHTFTYSTQRTHKLGLAPSVDTSRELISQILTDTLQRAVSDTAFIAELSAP